jgi:hypothetical protein
MALETKEVILPVSKKTVVLKEGDGYTERNLIKNNKKLYQTVPHYIVASIESIDGGEKPSVKDVQNLLVPDIEALLIEIFKLNNGSEFLFEYVCQSCGKEVEVGIDLDTLEFRKLKDGLEESTDPTIALRLPRTGKTVEVGCLTGKKETILMDLQASGVLDLSQGDYQCLRSIDGSKDFSYEDVVKLPLGDHRAIRRARRNLVCGYDVDVSVTCPECDAKEVINILMQRDFLFSG